MLHEFLLLCACLCQSFSPREFRVCVLESSRIDWVCRHHFTSRRFALYSVKTTCCRGSFCLACGERLLFCCYAVVEAFSAAGYQKPFVNKDLCTRKSVKPAFEKVKENALLRLCNLKYQAALVAGQISAHRLSCLVFVGETSVWGNQQFYMQRRPSSQAASTLATPNLHIGSSDRESYIGSSNFESYVGSYVVFALNTQGSASGRFKDNSVETDIYLFSDQIWFFAQKHKSFCSLLFFLCTPIKIYGHVHTYN